MLVSGQKGDQHIRIVFDSVQIVMVLVIIVGTLKIVQAASQFILHRSIRGLRPQHIRVGRGERGDAQNRQPALYQCSTGGQDVEQQGQREEYGDDNTHNTPVPDKKCCGAPGFLSSPFCGPGGTLHRGGGALAGADSGRVLFTDGPLLLPPGQGAAGKLGIILDVLLVQQL